jgi:hypothetical protein
MMYYRKARAKCQIVLRGNEVGKGLKVIEDGEGAGAGKWPAVPKKENQIKEKKKNKKI